MSKQFTWKYIFRKRIRFFVLIVVIFSFVYMFYQLFYFKQLNSDSVHSAPVVLVRGMHIKQMLFYTPNHLNQFTCIHSKEKIDFLQVNDDYCDCLDGSDEPGTNACTNGIFFCLFQDERKKYRRAVPSSMVNDGICDCCDGSDEWNAPPLSFRFDDMLQKKLGRYQTPCHNICYH